MVKKRKFWLYIVIAIAVIITGVLLYIFLKGKSQTTSGRNEGTTEVPSNNGNLSVIEQIKNIFTGARSGSSKGGSGGGGSSGGGGGGGSGEGSSGTTITPEFSTDKTICQNAQDGSLCDGLDVTYGGDYKTLCCSEHSLCC